MLALDRVYDNARARARLGWRPVHDFADIVAGLKREDRFGSDLARRIGDDSHDRSCRAGIRRVLNFTPESTSTPRGGTLTSTKEGVNARSQP